MSNTALKEVMNEFYSSIPDGVVEQGFNEAWNVDSDQILAAVLEDTPDLYSDYASEIQGVTDEALRRSLTTYSPDIKRDNYRYYGELVADTLKGCLKGYIEELWDELESDVRQECREQCW